MVAALLAHPQDLLATLALGNTFANAAMLAVALRMVFNAQWTLAPDDVRAAGVGAHRLRGASQNPGRAAAGTLGAARGLAAVDLSKSHQAAASRGPMAECSDFPKNRDANGRAAGDDGRGISRTARNGLPAGHARRIRKGNHPPNHQPRSARGARRHAAARRHGVPSPTTRRWRK